MRKLRIAILIGVAIEALGLPVAVSENALHIHSRPHPASAAADRLARETGSTWLEAAIHAEDGVPLDGWLFRRSAPNGGAVLLLHGVGDTRLGALGHLPYLLQAGYSVLVPDLRGHGASGGDFISYGLLEARDRRRLVLCDVHGNRRRPLATVDSCQSHLLEAADRNVFRLHPPPLPESVCGGLRPKHVRALAAAPQEFPRRVCAWFAQH